MGIDPFNLMLAGIILAIYASVCFISLIFTFFLETYRKIDERLNMYIATTRILTPIERNITWFDDWLMAHNTTIGPLLTILSLVDTKLSFDILNKL